MIRRLAVWLVLACSASIAVAQVAAPPAYVPEETMQKLLIHKVPPVRPADVPLEGLVVFRAVVDKRGSVEGLQMTSGESKFVPSAMDAVKQWKYRPYDVNGIAVKVETTIHVEFRGDADGSDTTLRSLQLAETPVRAESDMLVGHVLRKVHPVYPPLARQARIQGSVLLRIIIDKLGNVRDVQLVSGHPMLAPAAIEAVRQWKYYPHESNGEMVEVETDVRVNFRLRGA